MLIGRRAERHVLQALHQGLLFAEVGRQASRRADNPGWHIEFLDPKGQRVVLACKGTVGDTLNRFELTDREWRAARRLEHRYWIVFVTKCGSSSPKISLLQDPAKSEREGRLVVEPPNTVVRLLV